VVLPGLQGLHAELEPPPAAAEGAGAMQDLGRIRAFQEPGQIFDRVHVTGSGEVPLGEGGEVGDEADVVGALRLPTAVPVVVAGFAAKGEVPEGLARGCLQDGWSSWVRNVSSGGSTWTRLKSSGSLWP
jgi:hypothetical protein